MTVKTLLQNTTSYTVVCDPFCMYSSFVIVIFLS